MPPPASVAARHAGGGAAGTPATAPPPPAAPQSAPPPPRAREQRADGASDRHRRRARVTLARRPAPPRAHPLHRERRRRFGFCAEARRLAADAEPRRRRVARRRLLRRAPPRHLEPRLLARARRRRLDLSAQTQCLARRRLRLRLLDDFVRLLGGGVADHLGEFALDELAVALGERLQRAGVERARVAAFVEADVHVGGGDDVARLGRRAAQRRAEELERLVVAAVAVRRHSLGVGRLGVLVRRAKGHVRAARRGLAGGRRRGGARRLREARRRRARRGVKRRGGVEAVGRRRRRVRCLFCEGGGGGRRGARARRDKRRVRRVVGVGVRSLRELGGDGGRRRNGGAGPHCGSQTAASPAHEVRVRPRADRVTPRNAA